MKLKQVCEVHDFDFRPLSKLTVCGIENENKEQNKMETKKRRKRKII